MFSSLKRTWLWKYVKFQFYNKKWRKLNKHNYTEIGNNFPLNIVSVGNKTYGTIYVKFYGNCEEKLNIGSFCSISENVTFILGGEHTINTISTYPFRAMIINHKSEAISKGAIVIEDDVWIGYGVTIMSGVHVGRGAVIGACSVVTKDIPAYAVVGGIPAKLIKYRFQKNIIEELSEINYDKLDDDMILNNELKLYAELKDKQQLAWLPRKLN